METVYDHNTTPKEIEELSLLDKDLYLKLGKEAANMGLFRLFSLRGMKQKANYYFKKLPKATQEPFKMQDLMDVDF